MLPSRSALYLHSKPFRRFKTVFVSKFDLRSGTRIDTHGDPVVGVSVLRSRTTGKWDHVFSVDKQKGLWQSPPPACMPSSSKFCNKEKASKFSYLLHFRQTINQDRVKVCSVVFFLFCCIFVGVWSRAMCARRSSGSLLLLEDFRTEGKVFQQWERMCRNFARRFYTSKVSL